MKQIGFSSCLVLALFHLLDICIGFTLTKPELSPSGSFIRNSNPQFGQQATSIRNTNLDDLDSVEANSEPIAFSSGYSGLDDLQKSLEEATRIALESLPHSSHESKIDLAIVSVSSIYDAQYSPTLVVPTILKLASDQGFSIQNLVGSYTAGIIGSRHTSSNGNMSNKNNDDVHRLSTVEMDNAPGVVVTFGMLPDTNIQTFHVLGDDVPEDIGRISPETWKNSVGLNNFISEDNRSEGSSENGARVGEEAPTIMLLPSPLFKDDLDDLLRGLTMVFGPSSTVFGGVASTVSSLSRSRLFRYDINNQDIDQTLADGCVGMALSGDVKVKVIIAQGAKPVGGVYRVVSGEETSIKTIQLDEQATEQLQDNDQVDNEDEMNDMDMMDSKKKSVDAYAKAVIPKPVLAECNYLMKTLSDDDQAYMRKAILVGLEQSGGYIAKTPNELLSLAQGQGHQFTVHQVASASMSDGSVKLPIGSSNIKKGTRLRFFVRESDYAKKEVEAVLMGYKKKQLDDSFAQGSSGSSNLFTPAGCLFMPTIDRGTKLFGKLGYESSQLSQFLPIISSISGFYTNGMIGKLNDKDSQVMIHGSGSCYALIGSKSNRPIHNSAGGKKKENKELESESSSKNGASVIDKIDPISNDQYINDDSKPAPRSEDGELMLKRRDVHSGRALSVSSVEWSVAENIATPTSTLEGFMWDKETEVDRFRERVPLINLVSQCKLATLDPSKMNPRDWAGSIKLASQNSKFVIIPEIKRLEPSTGTLRKRYNIRKLAKQLTLGKASSISVNCDGVIFGGSLEDITQAREESTKTILGFPSAEDGVIALPIIASDLILYPYQLYSLFLAGADAFVLIAGALKKKDLLYLTKIASTLKLQTIISVTSEVQINSVTSLSTGSIDALVVSNRDLETFSFDDEGKQALDLLRSNAMKEFKIKHGYEVPILVEGRVGIIEMRDQSGAKSTRQYIKALKDAGAIGAIVGGGLAAKMENDEKDALQQMQNEC